MKKKILICTLTTAIMLSLAACSQSTAQTAGGNASASQTAAAEETKKETLCKLTSPEDVTADYIIDATTPSKVTDASGILGVTTRYANTSDAAMEGTSISAVYRKTEKYYEMSEKVTYGDGYSVDTYLSTDEEDNNYYMSQENGKDIVPMETGYAEDLFNYSLAGFAADNLKVKEVREENGLYLAAVETEYEGTVDASGTVTIDPASGRITKLETSYSNANGGSTSLTYEFSYEASLAVDYTAKLANGGSVEDLPTATAGDDKNSAGTAASTGSENNGQVAFDTVDINGNPVTSEILKDAKLVMLNFWEPWCKPCVNEMPDLQALYEKYKDQGLVVLGAYSAFDMQEDADAIVADKKISYPIIKCDDKLSPLQKDYFPATYFADGSGNLITAEPYAGANSYEDWEKIILSYLK